MVGAKRATPRVEFALNLQRLQNSRNHCNCLLSYFPPFTEYIVRAMCAPHKFLYMAMEFKKLRIYRPPFVSIALYRHDAPPKKKRSRTGIKPCCWVRIPVSTLHEHFSGYLLLFPEPLFFQGSTLQNKSASTLYK